MFRFGKIVCFCFLFFQNIVCDGNGWIREDSSEGTEPELMPVTSDLDVSTTDSATLIEELSTNASNESSVNNETESYSESQTLESTTTSTQKRM